MRMAQLMGLSLNCSKCTFGGKELTWLGHILTSSTRRPDPKRTSAFQSYPVPQTQKQLQRFLGISVYHSQWVPRFAETMDPLFMAVHRGVDAFPLNQQCLDSIAVVKSAVESSLLAVPSSDSPLRLETDASRRAVGAVLSQNGRPVAYVSHRLSIAEQRWSAAELEGYAVVVSIRKLRPFLRRRFLLICDQQGLVSALRSKSAIKNAKFERWRLELCDFDFEVQFRPGALNVAADALSRIASVTAPGSVPEQTPDLESIRQLHVTLGHPGSQRLADTIREQGLEYSAVRRSCEIVSRDCLICSEVKPKWIRPEDEAKLIQSTAPWERVSMDFMVDKPLTPRGNRHILHVLDEHTRFPFAAATPDRKTTTVQNVLGQIIAIVGPPKSVHTDRGAEFESAKFVEWLAARGIHKSRTTPYHPQGDGQVERYNGVLWNAVLCLLRERGWPLTDWDLALPAALDSLRTLPVKPTGQSPHKGFFAFPRRLSRPVSPLSVSTRIAPGDTAFLRRFVRNKSEPRGDPVEVVDVWPSYALVQRPGDRPPDTVNIRDLAPLPPSHQSIPPTPSQQSIPPTPSPTVESLPPPAAEAVEPPPRVPVEHHSPVQHHSPVAPPPPPPVKTRSGRVSRPVQKLDL